MATAYKADPVMATLPHAPLSKIRLDVYPNARNEMAEDYESCVEGMRESIASIGLVSPPTLTPYGEGYAAVAGFTRLLALLQLAIKPLADAANKLPDGTMKKKDDPTFININSAADRKRLRDLNPEAYDKVLAETTVPYTPKTVGNLQEARIINGIENLVRNDMSPRETAAMFLRILTDKENPVKAKTLAVRFDMSEGKISQYRKIAEFENSLPTFLSTPQAGENFTEDQLAQLKTTVNTLMKAYVHRLSLNPKKDEKNTKEGKQAITFQHAREITNRIQPGSGKTPLSRAVALTVMKKLLGWQETTGQLDPGHETPDFSTFCIQIDNAVKAASGVKEEAKAADGTAAAGTATGVNPADVTATAPVTTPAAGTTAMPQQPVTTSVQPGAGTPVGAAAQAEAAVANAQADAIETEEGSDVDDILDQAGEVAGDASAPAAPKGVKAGQVKTPESKYAKMCSGLEMDNFADAMLKSACDDGNRVTDTAMYLGIVSGIYESLRLKDEQTEIDKAYDEYANAVQEYVEKLEECLEWAKKANAPIKGLKDLVRPTFAMEVADETIAATV